MDDLSLNKNQMKSEQNNNLFWRLRIFPVTDEKLLLGNSYKLILYAEEDKKFLQAEFEKFL
jgi:hypothetical protein